MSRVHPIALYQDPHQLNRQEFCEKIHAMKFRKKIIWIVSVRDWCGRLVIVGSIHPRAASKWTELVQFRYFPNTIAGSKACSFTCQIKKALVCSEYTELGNTCPIHVIHVSNGNPFKFVIVS